MLCNQLETFASDLGDDQSLYLSLVVVLSFVHILCLNFVRYGQLNL